MEGLGRVQEQGDERVKGWRDGEVRDGAQSTVTDFYGFAEK